MSAFPSIDWFEQVREVYNSDSSLHSGGGGACDTLAGFKIGNDVYLIEFEGLKCKRIVKGDTPLPEETDFVIEMAPELWIDMVRNVQQHGKADLRHTLNSIDLSQENGIAYSPQDDQYRQDLFYRYNQNFQDFFDASSRVKTTFE